LRDKIPLRPEGERELAMFTTLKPPSMKTLATLLSLRNWGHIGRVFKRLKAIMAYVKSPAATTAAWAGKTYYSAGPYALGDGAMNVSAPPADPHHRGGDARRCRRYAASPRGDGSLDPGRQRRRLRSVRPARDARVHSGTLPWSPLQFNAWNTLPSMRPLGQLFRARKHVHKAHSEARLEHIYDAKPGAMVDQAPFKKSDTTASAEAQVPG
jgi:hypothetical protein